MFDGANFKGFIQNLTVNVNGLTDDAAVAAMVRTATDAKARVLGGINEILGKLVLGDRAQ